MRVLVPQAKSSNVCDFFSSKNVFTKANSLVVDVADFDKVIAINLRGVFLSYKYAAAQMVKQATGGRIIGMFLNDAAFNPCFFVAHRIYRVGASSVLGKQGGPGFCAYAASKFAVRGLTQSIGKSELHTQ